MPCAADRNQDTDQFDLFISYAHGDNVSGIVAALHDQLENDFQRLLQRSAAIFFDRSDIRDFDDWKVRCHRALRASRFFIVCLSPAYLASDACRWEWEEWLKHEVERGQVGAGAACIWFIEIASLDAPGDQERLRQWKNELRQRFGVAFHEWREGGREALQNTAAREELARLTEHVAKRLRLLALERSQRGNLGWPSGHFIGRETELRRLRAHLLDAPPAAPVALIGIGGIGKTALALTFAFREADAFPGGCWLLRCEGRARLDSALRTLVPDLGIELTDDEKLDDTLAARCVLDTLRPRGPALFLLDNVDTPALVAPAQLSLLAGETGIRLLITTRLAPAAFSAAGATVLPLDLDQLPEAEALDLIRSYQPDTVFASAADETAAREIVRLLGGLTIAIETAAVYLGQNDPRIAEAQYAVRIIEYLKNLRHDIAGGAGGGTAMSQLHEVAATIRPTLDRLDAPTRTVLQVAALLHPDAVPLPWLRAIAGKFHPALASDADIAERDEWTDLIRALIGMRLFHPTNAACVLTIHRLLHKVLATELRDNRAKLDAALVELVSVRDAVLKKTTVWQDARWELEPFDALAKFWDETEHPDAAWLLNQAGIRWHSLAEWTRAESLLKRALVIFEASMGPSHPYVAAQLNNLAMLLKATNRLAEAEPLMKRALAIWEQSLGENHPNVASVLNNLALLLKATNRLAEAEPLYRRALAIYGQSFGPDHPNVAMALDNLAMLLYATNRLAEAEPLMKRALVIFEVSIGPNHPDVATQLNNLALLLKATNRLAEAEPLYRRALAIYEQSFGPDHPNVAMALDNLALLLKATNRLVEAESLMKRALAIFEASIGPNHPDVATQLNNLALLLEATNRLAEAEPLMKRALAIDEQSFGPDHPNVATALNNLALLLQAMNRLGEAEPLMKRHLEMFLNFTRATGHPHPHLQDAVNNYAKLLGAMGRSREQILATLRKMAPELFG